MVIPLYDAILNTTDIWKMSAVKFRVTFLDHVEDIQTDKLNDLRRIFNDRIDKLNHIPKKHRAWMKSRDGRWLEIIDQAVMIEMLSDRSLVHDGNFRYVQFLPETDDALDIKRPINQAMNSTSESAFNSINPDLYQRIQYFVFDLLHLAKGAANLERFIGIDPIPFSHIYLSSYYFNESEMEFISSYKLGGKPIREHIADLSATLYSSNQSNNQSETRSQHICSSHDVAPIYREVFRLKHPFYSDGSFKKRRDEFVKSRNKQLDKQEKITSSPTSKINQSDNQSNIQANNQSDNQSHSQFSADELATARTELENLGQKISSLGTDAKSQAKKSTLIKQRGRIQQKYRL